MTRLAATLVASLLVAAVAAAGGPRVDAAPAARQTATTWEPVGLTGRITQLFTPASGAFYAVQLRRGGQEISTADGVYRGDGLWRSDDAGTSWRLVTLPPRSEKIWVDPADHSIVYALATSRLYKTTDGGATWSALVVPPFPSTGGPTRVPTFGISPADHQVLYVRASGDGMTLLIRSLDGGLTWETIVDERPDSVVTDLVQPHATDPARVLRLAGRYPAGNFVGAVEVSDDQGTTWEHHGQPDLADIGGLSTGITELVGFAGIMPERLYVTTRSWEPDPGHAPRPVGGSVFRSDDEGRTWTQILSIVHPGQEEIPPAVTALAYDPGNPDVVYVATVNGVQASRDGGQSWSRLGSERLPDILSLALGLDGHYLYAATDTGVLRLRLAD